MISEDRTPDAQKAALDDLVTSPGWRIVQELVERHFGAHAQIAEIDAAMRGTPVADVDFVGTAIVPQIRAAALGVQRLLALVEDKRKQVDAEVEKKPGLPDRFKALRRIPRGQTV